MYYRRLVSSTKYCHDTSNTEIITVLPLIGNNSFPRPDTAICTNSSPGLLNPELPTGGDGSYTYSWQVKALEGNWTTLPTSDQASNYAPAGMTMSSLFRRIVYSGNDHACIDTSSPKTVIVMPLITNNLLLGAGVKYTCFNSPITLSGSTPQNGFGSYGYGWEWSSDNIAWESIAGQQQNLITPALTQKKYFRRTVFSTPQFHECTSVSNVVEVRLNTLPAGDLIAQDVSLCSGETIYVKFTVAGHSPFSVTVQGESIAPQSKDNILASPDSVAFVPTSSMPFTMYSVRDDSGCFAHIDDFENIVHAIVYEVPVAQAGNDAEVCGLSHTLQAVKSLSGSSGLWSGDGVAFDSPNSENSVVTSTNYTTRVLRWTETNWNCQDEDDVVIVFYEQPAVPEAGPHQSLDFTFETRLDATSPVVGSGRWSVVLGSAVFDQDNLPNPVVNELSSFNILKYTITNGSCPPVSDSLEVKVEPLLIPKGFTPNGDTQNDVFNLGAEHAEWVKIKIFNSAGIIVYESDDYLMGDLFDGYNLDGVELPEGTYFYIADIKVTGRSEPVQFRSFVEILR
jgi:gliding motility-associated-like protein